MDHTTFLLLACGFALVAALYSSVGHAGASGYLAMMALAGVAPVVMRPTALALNIAVAAIGTYRFSRAGLTHWRALLPLVAASVPLAFLGGTIDLPAHGYRGLVGVVLLVSAAILAWRASGHAPGEVAVEPEVNLPLAAAIAIGLVIGLLSGLTGTGGGIFLSPLLLLAGRAGPRRTAGLAAPFILLNSLAGIAGLGWSRDSFPPGLLWLVLAVLAGGLIGTRLGTQRLPARVLLGLLAAVLVIAGAKLIGT